MKNQISALALVAALAVAGASAAQPVGGSDAKGNAPLKAPHTVNDGSGRPGANSFTEGQAKKHIERAGFSDVSGLTKGDDGVWRGTAMKNGASMAVAMDFKGNVTTGGPAGGARHVRSATTTTRTAAAPAPAPAMAPPASADTAGAGDQAAPAATTTTTTTASGMGAHHRRHHRRMHHRHHRRHHHHHAMQGGVPGEQMDGQGAAMSGVDSNQSGISDKEKRATGR